MFQRRGSPLGNSTEGFLGDCGQAAGLIADGRIVIDFRVKNSNIPLPPLNSFQQFVCNLGRASPPRQQMLCPINLRGLPEDRRSSTCNQSICSNSQRRVCRHARIPIGPPTLGRQHQVAGGTGFTPSLIHQRQQPFDLPDSSFNGGRSSTKVLHDKNRRALPFGWNALDLHQLLVLQQNSHRTLFATKPNKQVAANIWVFRHTTQYTIKHLMARTLVLHAASTLMREGNHSVDIGII